jgi:hypothetical protein
MIRSLVAVFVRRWCTFRELVILAHNCFNVRCLPNRDYSRPLGAACLGRRGKIMPSILKIKITLAVLAAFVAAVAIATAATSAHAATGASQLRASGTDAYAPMGLFRC